MIKLSVNETKWSCLLARTRALILYISIWIFDYGPVKLPGLSRNGPMETIPDRASVHTSITLNVVLSRTIQKRIFLITIYNQLRLGFGAPNPPTRPSGGFSSSDGGGGLARLIPTLRWVGGVRSPKNFCRPFGPQFALKNKGEPGPPGPFPGSATATAPERSSMWVNDLFQFCAVALHSIPDTVNIT